MSDRVLHIGPAASFTIRRLTLQNGNATEGAGIFVDHSGLFRTGVIDTVVIRDNHATGSGGGASFPSFGSYPMPGQNACDAPLLVDSVLEDNHAAGRGGGVQYRGAESGAHCLTIFSTIRRTVIRGNSASDGGGVDLRAVPSVQLQHHVPLIDQSTISGNTVTNHGGGVGFDDSAARALVILKQSTVSGNTAGSDGGGLNVNTLSGSLNSTISGNQATSQGGGVSAQDFIAHHLTVTANQAATGGGLFRRSGGSSGAIRSSIVAGNPGGDCAGVNQVSQGWNIAGDGSCTGSS